jgi:16S rRNA (cytosine967-C5)-methyltransferase
LSAPTPARRAAYEVLRRVFEHGAYADRALRSAAERAGLEGRERALAQRLAYGAVQRRRSCDYAIERLARRPVDRIDPPLLAALRLGAYELLFEHAAEHAAVDQAVGLAKGRAGGRRQRGAGLVNAVLRRMAGEGGPLLAALGADDPAAAAISHSLPDWIAELWWAERGPERARRLMAAANEPPPRVFRVTPRGQQEGIAPSLAGAGVLLEAVDPNPGGADLIEVRGGEWPRVEAGVERGGLVPQSIGSAAAAALLGVEPGDRVLDLCAAPGIKTTQLAALAGSGGSVVAVERDPGRAGELRSLCERVGAGNVEVIVADGREIGAGGGYDRVLVDAPCSGLGTLASRPDLRWRRSAAEIEPMASMQRALLEAGASALRPGGSLTYSVCTISRREGEGVVSAVLADRDGLRADDLGSEWPSLADDREPRFLQLLCDRDRTDGFFIARIGRGDG